MNLGGLLNILDGVAETPGRVSIKVQRVRLILQHLLTTISYSPQIVIITTNHPELLDSALKRPGRVDKIVELGYMTEADAAEMIKHYCQADLLHEQQKQRLVSPGG